MFTRVVFAALLGFPASAEAVELHHITVRTGTEGLSPVTLTVTNAGNEPIACNADIAHWYSLELATAASGAALKIELWFDPKTGTYAALNDKHENLPVERLWCGLAGRAYATRALIPLERHAQAQPATEQALTCSSGEERLACR